MLKADLMQQNKNLQKEINELKNNIVNKGLEELILDVIRTKLTFEEDGSEDIIVKLDGKYLDSFNIRGSYVYI